MEERGLKVLENNTTFLNKLSNTITKLLIPTKVGINGMMINIKRNNVIKAYEAYLEADVASDAAKKEASQKKYEEMYSLYLESIDKYIMDSIYKKVKNNTASTFEREALAKYYTVVQLKENEYVEYKHRKQKFLLELDYDSLKTTEKAKMIDRYKPLYIIKQDALYKGILKNCSVQLADGIRQSRTDLTEVYVNIFDILEEYINNILPLKLERDEKGEYNQILKEYDEYEKFTVGKLDERDCLEKDKLLLGLSRKLFTHSLPLVAAEQCYDKLVRDTRRLIINSKTEAKQEEAYKMLMSLLEDYNVKLLSTKVYWENLNERDYYKKFWAEFKKCTNEDEKEVLLLRKELYDLEKVPVNKERITEFYRQKLVDFGVMRELKDSCRTGDSTKYIKIKKDVSNG